MPKRKSSARRTAEERVAKADREALAARRQAAREREAQFDLFADKQEAKARKLGKLASVERTRDTLAAAFARKHGLTVDLDHIRRMAEFRRNLYIVEHSRRGTSPKGQKAKALVALGVRDEYADYLVGESPPAKTRRGRALARLRHPKRSR